MIEEDKQLSKQAGENDKQFEADESHKLERHHHCY